MATPIVTTPDTAYVTKDNIVFPGSSAQKAAMEARATAELNARFPSLTIYVGADPTPGS